MIILLLGEKVVFISVALIKVCHGSAYLEIYFQLSSGAFIRFRRQPPGHVRNNWERECSATETNFQSSYFLQEGLILSAGDKL